MFDDFYQTALEWLQKNDHLDAIQSLSLKRIGFQERNPDRIRLWDRRIRLLFPPEKTEFLHAHPYIIEIIVLKLADLGQYAGKQSLSKLVDRHLSGLLDTVALDDIKHALCQFHEKIPLWEDGTWHRNIQENRYQAVEMLTKNAGFADDWESARFLSGCAYMVPSSQRAFKEWLRFDGNPESNADWRQWISQLQSLAVETIHLYEMDFLLNAFFEWQFRPTQNPFGATPSSCHICPLNTNCHHFNKIITNDEKISIENLIRVGDTNDLQSSSLIPFLAGERYTGTDFQHGLINNKSNTAFRYTHKLDIDSEDERFLLFFNALKIFSEKHSSDRQSPTGTIFNKSEVIYHEIKSGLENLTQEAFYTLILDNRYRKILFKEITKGTLNRSLIHPREIFAPAIQLRAAAVILVHNHPSGDPHPSSQDIEITKRLIESGKIIGINVVDHVIIGRNAYFSFVDEDLM